MISHLEDDTENKLKQGGPKPRDRGLEFPCQFVGAGDLISVKFDLRFGCQVDSGKIEGGGGLSRRNHFNLSCVFERSHPLFWAFFCFDFFLWILFMLNKKINSRGSKILQKKKIFFKEFDQKVTWPADSLSPYYSHNSPAPNVQLVKNLEQLFTILLATMYCVFSPQRNKNF